MKALLRFLGGAAISFSGCLVVSFIFCSIKRCMMLENNYLFIGIPAICNNLL